MTGVLLTPEIDNDSTQVTKFLRTFNNCTRNFLTNCVPDIDSYLYYDNIKLKVMTLAVQNTVKILINLKKSGILA